MRLRDEEVLSHDAYKNKLAGKDESNEQDPSNFNFQASRDNGDENSGMVDDGMKMFEV